MSQDPLHFLPSERWDELQSLFKADWPRGISGYAALEIQKLWKKQGIEYNFRVYCPFDDASNGMVAINEKDTFYEIIIQSPNDDTDKLRDALKNTNVIDWNRTIIVPYAHRNVIECLHKTVQDINVILDEHRALETFIREQTYEDVSLPSNITFGPVTLEHLDLVDTTWPNRYSNSSWQFELLIKAKCGFGLYAGKALIAWVFMKEAGPLQHLYTVEEHRRKGYAEILMKLAGNIWLKEGKPVFAFCFKDNVSACNMYRKLGFIQGDEVAWCYIHK